MTDKDKKKKSPQDVLAELDVPDIEMQAMHGKRPATAAPRKKSDAESSSSESESGSESETDEDEEDEDESDDESHVGDNKNKDKHHDKSKGSTAPAVAAGGLKSDDDGTRGWAVGLCAPPRNADECFVCCIQCACPWCSAGYVHSRVNHVKDPNVNTPCGLFCCGYVICSPLWFCTCYRLRTKYKKVLKIKSDDSDCLAACLLPCCSTAQLFRDITSQDVSKELQHRAKAHHDKDKHHSHTPTAETAAAAAAATATPAADGTAGADTHEKPHNADNGHNNNDAVAASNGQADAKADGQHGDANILLPPSIDGPAAPPPSQQVQPKEAEPVLASSNPVVNEALKLLEVPPLEEDTDAIRAFQNMPASPPPQHNNHNHINNKTEVPEVVEPEIEKKVHESMRDLDAGSDTESVYSKASSLRSRDRRRKGSLSDSDRSSVSSRRNRTPIYPPRPRGGAAVRGRGATQHSICRVCSASNEDTIPEEPDQQDKKHKDKMAPGKDGRPAPIPEENQGSACIVM